MNTTSFLSLSVDVHGSIGEFLPANDAGNYLLSCKTVSNKKAIVQTFRGRDKEFYEVLKKCSFDVDKIGFFKQALHTIVKIGLYQETTITNEKLGKMIQACVQLQKLVLIHCDNITNDGYQSIGKAKNLHTLLIADRASFHCNFAHQNSELRSLHLYIEQGVQDVESLALEQLEEFTCHNDRSLQEALPANMKSLRKLHINNCSVDLFEKYIAPLKIQELTIEEISDEVLQLVTQMPTVQKLALPAAKISERGMQYLSTAPYVEESFLVRDVLLK